MDPNFIIALALSGLLGLVIGIVGTLRYKRGISRMEQSRRRKLESENDRLTGQIEALRELNGTLQALKLRDYQLAKETSYKLLGELTETARHLIRQSPDLADLSLEDQRLVILKRPRTIMIRSHIFLSFGVVLEKVNRLLYKFLFGHWATSCPMKLNRGVFLRA